MARHAQEHAPAAETLWSAIAVTRGIPFPPATRQGLRSALHYAEHSGAGIRDGRN